MIKTEAIYLVSFLGELSDRFGNDGCNDMFLPDTPENRELVMAANKNSDDPETRKRELNFYKGKIGTNNWHILDYLKAKFIEENDLTKKDLINTQE